MVTLDDECVHIVLTTGIVIVCLVIVAANALVGERPALPAALGIVVEGQIYERTVLFSESVVYAIVDQTTLLIDTGEGRP